MVQYECKKCLFSTTHKPNYNRHLSTEKHKRNEIHNCFEKNKIDEKDKNNEIKNNKKYICKSCSQHFSSRQSLHRHVKSRCKVIKEHII